MSNTRMKAGTKTVIETITIFALGLAIGVKAFGGTLSGDEFNTRPAVTREAREPSAEDKGDLASAQATKPAEEKSTLFPGGKRPFHHVGHSEGRSR